MQLNDCTNLQSKKIITPNITGKISKLGKPSRMEGERKKKSLCEKLKQNVTQALSFS